MNRKMLEVYVYRNFNSGCHLIMGFQVIFITSLLIYTFRIFYNIICVRIYIHIYIYTHTHTHIHIYSFVMPQRDSHMTIIHIFLEFVVNPLLKA